MIIPVIGLIIGAIFGVLRAKAKEGNSLDQLQWGAVFAMIFGLVGLFILIIIERAYT